MATKRKADAIERILERVLPLAGRFRGQGSGDDEEMTDSDEADELDRAKRRSHISKVVTLMCTSLLLSSYRTRERAPPVVKDRKSWEQYRAEKVADNSWWQAFRMTPEEFDVLLEYLRPQLIIDDKKAKCATPNGALSPAQRLAMTIQFCAGCTVGSLLDIYSCSTSVVYKIVWTTIDAIIACDQLGYAFDVSDEVNSLTFLFALTLLFSV